MMKYYVYISDAKVDMLLPQIPHEEKKRLATEFKFDLKLLSGSRRTETESEDNRFTRLEAVVAYIREFGNIGSVDEPSEYIEDNLDMRWGPYEPSDESEPLVYFGGTTDQTIVGLGGSVKHVIGNTGPSSAHSHSVTAVLLERLKLDLSRTVQPIVSSEQDPPSEVLAQPGDWSLRAVELATTQMEGPSQPMEFMARRLLYGRGISKKKKVLLATPLYVALMA